MFWDYGHIFKQIRQNKGLTQSDLTDGNLSPTTLSRLENGKLTPSIETFEYLLNQLGMTYDEFQFLSYSHVPNERKRIIDRFSMLISNCEESQLHELETDCKLYLSSNSDRTILIILNILESTDLLRLDQKNKIECLPKIVVNPVWSYLEKMNQWYLEDLRFLNCILYYLPVDTIIDLLPKMLAGLNRYDEFRDTVSLRLAMMTNVSTILLQHQEYDVCLQLLLKTEQWAKQAKRYDFLAVVLIRKGICSKEDSLITSGLTLLNLTGEVSLEEDLKKEVSFHDACKSL